MRGLERVIGSDEVADGGGEYECDQSILGSKHAGDCCASSLRDRNTQRPRLLFRHLPRTSSVLTTHVRAPARRDGFVRGRGLGVHVHGRSRGRDRVGARILGRDGRARRRGWTGARVRAPSFDADAVLAARCVDTLGVLVGALTLTGAETDLDAFKTLCHPTLGAWGDAAPARWSVAAAAWRPAREAAVARHRMHLRTRPRGTHPGPGRVPVAPPGPSARPTPRPSLGRKTPTRLVFARAR